MQNRARRMLSLRSEGKTLPHLYVYTQACKCQGQEAPAGPAGLGLLCGLGCGEAGYGDRCLSVSTV